MAKSTNNVTLVGNVIEDTQLKYTSSGTAILNFRMATNRSYKKDGEWIDEPSYHKIVVWGKLAEEIEKHIKKGTKVYVNGRIQYKTVDLGDVRKFYTDIVAEEVIPTITTVKETRVSKEDDEDSFHEPTDDTIDPDEIPF